ncbi:M23 family metallopeptidase [Streptomyces gobiensis]|uniref:M23 family metallopeptidase n=1 Tax=Streptomyces gobiensis TaxID=2875706 RepID=UPI001E65DB6B|nr:M23 family metallopeptidase [Streptomyces gobiensis]UGY93199.1 peptidoglycan DD-metalloendopeptidase family protein [Streptomyces gobiensis]
MNDRPPSGVSAPTGTASDSSYAAYDAGYEQSYGQGVQYGYVTGTDYPVEDPLFGALPGQQGQTASMATAAYDTGAYDSGGYDTSGYDTSGYDAGGYDTSAMWSGDGYQTGAHIPAQGDYGWVADSTGQWHTTSYGTGTGTGTGTYATVGYDSGGMGNTGGYDTTTWDSGAYATLPEHPEQPAPEAEPGSEHPHESELRPEPGPEGEPEPIAESPAGPPPDVTPPAAPAANGRGRRRAAKPKRSALLTVAVPSVAVMGVAGIAAASVGGVGGDGDDTPAQASPDPTQVKPSVANSKLDTQLAGLSAEAGDFGRRASRVQERIDLKERQEAERKRKEAEAARKEAMRPKFALPVAQQGLSAYYGQAGLNWMSVHTGIDFPVSYGTPVMAATDGTVTTKWDLSYGNMAIVTAPDGTETWYCHLSSTKIRSGHVKAGDTIAYSGNSGNSTGPHLHFEVRPGGGSAIDPLAWFRAKGLDPT